jgi:uncharacterized protein (DUF1501 family)
MITRRQFLIGGAASGVAAGAMTIERDPLVRLLRGRDSKALSANDGVLVLLTMYGGNDGLNTVVPYQDSAYQSGRGDLAFKPSEVIPIGGGLGLHGSLKELKGLWDHKQVAIVRGVGYPDPNRSHFRSMDIWQSASPQSAVSTGWLGRWLDKKGGDPLLAVSVGPTLPLALRGERTSGTAVPLGPFTVPGPPPLVQAFTDLQKPGHGLPPLGDLVAQSGANLLTASHTISSVVSGAKPANGNSLSAQLDLVSTLIKAKVPARIYSVSLPGFDTHTDEKATQARLLSELDAAVSGFFKGLAGDSHAGKVVLVAYSEFGRRVAANASGGTDHGTAGPVFVIGQSVKGGFLGDEPSLTALDPNGDLKSTVDFRSVYGAVSAHILGTDPEYKPLPGLF